MSEVPLYGMPEYQNWVDASWSESDLGLRHSGPNFKN